GKISFYLCPCPVMTVRWDKRFGYSIDPARFNIFAIHTHEFTSVDAILPNMLWLLRLRGYAPPFLVEGLAGYFDFVPYKIKKLKDKGSIPRISDLVTTAGYFRADPVEAEITAAAFVKYLADSYGLTKILDLYDRSDDLTLVKNIESIYEKPLDSLEMEWANYIDTVSLSRMLFDRYAGRANALFQSDLQIEYLQQMTEYDKTNYDSVDTWQKLSMVYYQYGQYYDAIDGYKLLAAIDPAKPLYQQVLGNLYLITGSYDSAWSAFDAAVALDTAFATARLLQARILTIRGDTAAAIELAEEAYGSEQTMAGKIEFLLFLGEMYQTGGKYYDSVKADRNFSDALVWANDMIPKAPEDPAFKLRAGLALFGLGEYEHARQHLELARFTELRAFYLGRTLLALGNLYDVLGEHDRAIEYYQKALSIPLSAHDRELCEKYAREPYRR
ncbi:MAG: tetratricopeptide repeat protein, partial [Candidatus Zixiibacteriota bacterium]